MKFQNLNLFFKRTNRRTHGCPFNFSKLGTVFKSDKSCLCKFNAAPTKVV